MKNTCSLNHAADMSLVSNAFGFLRSPLVFEPYDSPCDVVITGAPFDMATSGRAGARFGPRGIREASLNLAWEGRRYPWDFALEERLRLADCGDLVYDFGDPAQFQARLAAHVDRLLERGKFPVTLGGDHFITLPVLRAFGKKYGTLALIHFDAHSDTYATGSGCDHGTMFHHLPREGIVDPGRSVQIGIRTEYHAEDGFKVIDGDLAADLSAPEIARRICGITEGLPAYLSFDIDCLDPACAPGTGTPVCGGLSTGKILRIIRELGPVNFVGMDLVEVSPPWDHSGITSLAAATIILDFLYLLASGR